CSGRRTIRRGVIVDMGRLAVLLLFVARIVFVTMCELVVVVLVTVPRRSMFPLAQRIVRGVVRDVIMIVQVNVGRMGVLRLIAFGPLPLDSGRLLMHGLYLPL